ncbi:MAG: MarR family transcriptional regulator [Candidatus Omnitrophota bacterium]|jgi:DNA-binding MarR family transcriptional regulator
MSRLSLEAFADRALELFPQLVRGMARHENNYLTKGVITLPQVWVLRHLSRQRECSMRELADFMKTGLSSVTGMVDRLVKQGLVNRRRTERDRRLVFVDITAKGRKILREILSQRRETTLNLFESLTAEERSTYLCIVEKLVKKLSRNGLK